jgi:hypothetical protein
MLPRVIPLCSAPSLSLFFSLLVVHLTLWNWRQLKLSPLASTLSTSTTKNFRLILPVMKQMMAFTNLLILLVTIPLRTISSSQLVRILYLVLSLSNMAPALKAKVVSTVT